jgi:hypothetical protein
MTQQKNKSATSASKKTRIEWNLFYSTEYNSPLQLAANKVLTLRDQFKYGRTDDQIMSDIITEFSSSKSYNNFISEPGSDLLKQ